jgi:hypothetical protein
MHSALGAGTVVIQVAIVIIRHEMISGAWISRVNIMDSKNMLRNRARELASYVLTLIYVDHEHEYKEEGIRAHKRRRADKAECLDPWSPEAPRLTYLVVLMSTQGAWSRPEQHLNSRRLSLNAHLCQDKGELTSSHCDSRVISPEGISRTNGEAMVHAKRKEDQE